MNRFVGLLLACTFSISSAEEESPTDPLALLLEDSGGEITALAEAMLGKKGGDKLFYFPSRNIPYTPAKYDLVFEEVRFPSTDESELHGWFLPAADGAEKAKGTVVFSHGNAGSVSYHLDFVDWLPAAGFNVLLYDYRGYGKSTGKVTRKGLIDDVSSALAYAGSREDVDGSRLFSYAHSLGGAKSIAALGLEPVKGVRGVITFGGFSSYRKMARAKLGAVGENLTTDELSPVDLVGELSPVPLLIIHGAGDRMVPIAQAKELFEQANEPKTLVEVEGAGHGNALDVRDGEARQTMLEWMDALLEE